MCKNATRSPEGSECVKLQHVIQPDQPKTLPTNDGNVLRHNFGCICKCRSNDGLSLSGRDVVSLDVGCCQSNSCKGHSEPTIAGSLPMPLSTWPCTMDTNKAQRPRTTDGKCMITLMALEICLLDCDRSTLMMNEISQLQFRQLSVRPILVKHCGRCYLYACRLVTPLSDLASFTLTLLHLIKTSYPAL